MHAYVEMAKVDNFGEFFFSSIEELWRLIENQKGYTMRTFG